MPTAARTAGTRVPRCVGVAKARPGKNSWLRGLDYAKSQEYRKYDLQCSYASLVDDIDYALAKAWSTGFQAGARHKARRK